MSRGHRVCLTIIDRFTRFPEAIQLENASTDTVARALLYHWISRFGKPLKITSDRGAQFTSDFFNQLNKLLGTKHLKTTPYHPQVNGLVERLHRQLKTALLCHNDSWTDALSSKRTSARDQPNWSMASQSVHPENFSCHRINNYEPLNSEPTSQHGKHPVFKFKTLNTASHVFIRHGQIEASFSKQYDGPYRVLERHKKHNNVLIRGKTVPISLDNLKPAFIIIGGDKQISTQPTTPTPTATTPPQPAKSTSSTTSATTKRSKRVTFA